MKIYDMKNIRNIAFVGASGSGKTTLTERILFDVKATTRLGKVEEGNTVMDFDPEEIAKGMTLNLSLAHLDFENSRINIIDTPGYADFVGDQIYAISAVETALIVVNAAAGYEVGLELAMENLENSRTSRALIVNRMDSENADFYKTIDNIKENNNVSIAPILIPIGRESKFEGVIDVLTQKAYINNKLVDVPVSMKDELASAREKLTEAAAEADEQLTEKYLETLELSDEEILIGLKKGTNEGKIIPAFACSANTGVGIQSLLWAIKEYLPSPADKKETILLENNEEKTFISSPDGEVIAYVFKSIADPNVGDLAYVRVFSGSIKSGLDLYVPEKDSKEKVSGTYLCLGKTRKDAAELKAGEIGGLVKLKAAKTLNSIVEPHAKHKVKLPQVPTPLFWKTIKATNQSDEDKIGAALTKLVDEDATLNIVHNTETHEIVLAGIGEQQINLIQKKLLSRFKVSAELHDPKISYKETIVGNSDVRYRHKKQSGGRGQYGEVYFRVSPKSRGEGYEFVDNIVGGVIPGKYIPAVEKGIVELMNKGIIAGYPVVDFKVELYFGSYHDVDSSEMAFKIAASQCLKEGFKKANPILLEPYHKLYIVIPNEYMGDVMGDISTRRGKIMGMEQAGKKQILTAQIPMQELFEYYPSLKSLTQGRGRFTQEFSHFEKVPDEIASKVIAAYHSDDEQ